MLEKRTIFILTKPYTTLKARVSWRVEGKKVQIKLARVTIRLPYREAFTF